MAQDKDYKRLLKAYDKVEDEIFVGDLFLRNIDCEEGDSSDNEKGNYCNN